MINYSISFNLPEPWTNKAFNTQNIGSINFLVGPNGSGKSRFAAALKAKLNNARLLSTDRLSGMEGGGGIRNIIGDHFAGGYAKNQFPHLKQSGLQNGSGLDTLVLLEERLDLRIQVESTLSHLFNRKIKMEWDSGNLIAKATLGSSGTSYRLDRDECHGIKELLVLLTHLYNNEHGYLIIDEPELNLHPQYQSFFMQEVRRVAGDPTLDASKKVVFLITHSPFMLDFRSAEDVKSVISFDLRHSEPKHIFDLGEQETRHLATLVPRLNVHHKQLFFSDNPVFVEGIIDAQLIESIQSTRGVSTASAGSCIIDAGGCEEVNHYLNLCTYFGKKAYFLYDLDSLFNGNLRACIRDGSSIQSFLAALGVNPDFVKYCGQLDSHLTLLIDKLIASQEKPPSLQPLLNYLTDLGVRKDWTPNKYAKGRVAVLSAISLFRPDLVSILGHIEVESVEGQLSQICAALQVCNVLLLPRGAIELYMPSYTGDSYKIPPEAKNSALSSEIQVLADGLTCENMQDRYGDLFNLICLLPSKPCVDVEAVLKEYLGNYIHELQGVIVENQSWGIDELRVVMGHRQGAAKKVFSIESFQQSSPNQFTALIKVEPMLGHAARNVEVNERTNAGMRGFTLVSTNLIDD